MSIRVQCGACGAKYNVADSMAGKRVRCKQCGAVFGVAAPGEAGAGQQGPQQPRDEGAPEEPDFSAIIEDEGEEEPGDRRSDVPTPFQQHATPPPPPRRPNVLPPVSRMPGEEPDEGEEEGAEDEAVEAPPPVMVANVPFRFRGSRQIDASLAYVIAIIGITWMVAQTLLADTPSGKDWINYVRIGLYLLAYTIVVYPMALLGVSVAGRKVHFGFPRQHKWKVFAVFSLPFMLGVILSLNGGLAAFIGGVLVGLLGALGAFWFLYRLRPTQTGTGLAYVGGFTAVGVAVAVLLGVGLNAALLASLRASKTAREYTISPLGPAFAWEAPLPPAPMPRRQRGGGPGAVDREQTADASASQPTTTATTEDAAQTRPAAGTQPAMAVANTSTTQATETTTPGDQGAAPTTRMVAANVQAPAATAATTEPASQPATTAPAVAAAAVASPLVAGISTDLPTGAFEGVAFAPGTNPAAMLIVRSRGSIADQLEVWSTHPPMQKTAELSPQHPKDVRSDYWLAAKGQQVVRVIDFPHTMVEVRAVATDTVVKEIDLDVTNNGEPEIAGFGASNQIIILWNHGGEYGIELFDLGSGVRTRSIPPKEMPGFQKGKGNLAVSPDGRYLALAVKTASGPAVQLVDVTAPARAPMRQFPVVALGASKPPAFTGIAFAPDSQRFGVFYEEAGSGLIVTFKPPDVKQQSQQTLFSDRPTEGTEYQGAAFEWMPDGAAWLLYGHKVVENERVLGDLGIANLKAHHLLDKETILAVVCGSGAGEKRRLEVVKLDAGKLAGMEKGKAKN